MEAIVALIHKHTDQEGLQELPKKLEKEAKKLKKGAIFLPAVVSPEHHTYGFLFLLHLKATQTEIKDHAEFVLQAKDLMLRGDGYQIRMGAKLFSKVSSQFRMSLILTDQAIRGVLPLFRGVEKLRGTNVNLLTSVHADMMYACLKSHHYRAAIPILDTPVFSIEPKDNGIEPKEYVEFFYYAGTICVGLKRYSQALDMFLMGLTCPSSADVLSAVQVETFKKYVLVCLIHHGEFRELPSITSPTVKRHVERLCAPYMDLSKAYKQGLDDVQRVIADNLKAFNADNNFGLVKQTAQALVRRKIQRLTSTYVTLSLSHIAQQANLKSPGEAEAHVKQMIEDGEIFAKINQKDGMLSFLDDPEDYNSSEMVHQLDDKLKQVMRLSDKLQAVNQDLLLNPVYISKQLQEHGGMREEGLRRGPGEDDDLQMAMAASLVQH